MTNLLTKLRQIFLSENRSLRLNTISNLFGSGWSALLGLLVVPLYLYYLGVEAYGIIGLFYTIQAFTVLLDFGVSVIIGRELAHHSAHAEKSQEARDMARTTEIVTWVMGFALGLALVGLSPVVAKYWLNSEKMSTEIVTQALMIMSAGFVAQWAINFYTNGLIGLQRQYALNTANVVFSTFRMGGGVLVLAFASRTIQALMIWQALIFGLHALAMALIFRKYLPEAPSPGRFKWAMLREKWRFAAGVTSMGVLGLILYQLDKVILSKMLSLEVFGYYVLATTIVNSGLLLLARGVSSAVYPRFSVLVSKGDEDGLKALYHRSTQILAALMLPAAAMLILYPYEILKLWTQNAVTAENSWRLLSVLTIGTVLNGFLFFPYYLQLAHGWTRIVINSALVSIAIVVPTILFMVNQYGAMAGAIGWLLLNVVTIILNVIWMHRLTLRGEQWRWYFEDIAKPFCIALAVAASGKLFVGADDPQLKVMVILCVAGILTYAITSVSIRSTRDLIIENYRRLAGRVPKTN